MQHTPTDVFESLNGAMGKNLTKGSMFSLEVYHFITETTLEVTLCDIYGGSRATAARNGTNLS